MRGLPIDAVQTNLPAIMADKIFKIEVLMGHFCVIGTNGQNDIKFCLVKFLADYSGILQKKGKNFGNLYIQLFEVDGDQQVLVYVGQTQNGTLARALLNICRTDDNGNVMQAHVDELISKYNVAQEGNFP